MTSGTVDQAFALVRLASEHGPWDLYLGELQFRIEEDGRTLEPQDHGQPEAGEWMEAA